MDESTVIFTKSDSVAEVVLNRPSVINAYNVEMRDELFQVLEAIRDDPQIRVAVFRGAGDKGFCAGADLTEFGTTPSQTISREVRWERDVWGLFLNIKKPLIAALHGHVIGSGLEIACLCDLRIASDDAIFRMPETSLGMIPAAGGTQTLPRIVGKSQALNMLMSGQIVTANDAIRIGLIDAVVPKYELLNQVRSWASDLATQDPLAISLTKTAIYDGMNLSLDQGLCLEKRLSKQISSYSASSNIM